MEIILDWLGALADGLIWLAVLGVATFLVAGTARRVLGVRVGWPRTIVCGIAIVALVGATGSLFIEPDAPDHANLPAQMVYLGVATLWTFAIAAAVLVVLEIVVPTGSLPTLRSLFFGWGRRWRQSRRTSEIMGIAARHGLGSQLRGVRAPDPDSSRMAVSLRKALQEAGVTFTKLGQMLSTRADLLPPAYVVELTKLTNRAEPEGWDAVRSVLETELGRPVSEVFAEVDTEPLAAASVAQVHTARLADGREVVVKVQRPEALVQVEQDVEILLRIARGLEARAPWARAMGVFGLAKGFAESLAEELDYRVEVANMAAVRASLAGHGVRVPWVVDELCSERVIVMERFDGTPVAQASALLAGLGEDQRKASASVLLRSVLAQIVGEGVFHADLHAGNVVIWPSGEVGLLDPGLDLVAAARETGRSAVGEVTPERVKEEFSRRALHALPLLENLPRRLNKISADLEDGRLTAHLRVLSHPEDSSFVSGLVQQLVVAVLAGAAVLGGILLGVAPGPEALRGVTVNTLLGALLAFAGFVLALRAVAQVFGRSSG